MMRRYNRLNLVPILVLLSKQVASGFVVGPSQRRVPFRLYASDVETSVESMRAGEIKRELESYGISTKSFLEKSELVEALKKARAEGLKPKQSATTTTTASSTSTESSSESREKRMREEMEKCRTMKASELRKELEERGVSTKSFFEKSELVTALAAARVDGVQKEKKSGPTSEGYAEYKDVEVLTDDTAGPRKKSSAKEQQPQGNPFGGAGGASPFGGMGNMADMLKNMGFGGAAPGANPFGGAGGANPFGGAGGANPFGGAGGANPFGGAAGANPFGNPFGGMGGFGDTMGKAQELMKNPKVREIMAKAQSNPRIMAKVNECMSNPSNFAKYQNDPEVKELVDELRKYI